MRLQGRQVLLLIAAAAIICAAPRRVAAAGSASDYNMVWSSPSTTELNSIPLGNGDIGINAWIENNRDVVFYLGKTDALDENSSLLKVGKVRVRLPAGLLPSTTQQQFRFQDGTIQFDAGSGSTATTVKLWGDQNNPVVQVDVQSATALNVNVTTEPWRTSRRLYPTYGSGSPANQEKSTCSGFVFYPNGTSGGDTNKLYLEPDTVATGQTNSVVFYHRNITTTDHPDMWAVNLTQQGLDPADTAHVGTNPLLNRTFGCKIVGDAGTTFSRVSDTEVQSTQAATHQVVSVYAHTAQTDTAQQWTDQINQKITTTQNTSYDARKAANDQWWSNYSQKNFIRVTGGPDAAAVSKNYAAQMMMNEMGGRGNMPIKFSGSIFTVAMGTHAPDNVQGRTIFNNLNQDFRRWGALYWSQSNRWPYWAMLGAGQFQEVQQYFDLYVNNLTISKYRVQQYWGSAGAQGAMFPETMSPWGTLGVDDYGWNKSNKKDGVPTNGSIRYYYSGVLETAAMMCQYYDYTQDQNFVSQKLVPLASEVVTFYDTHYARSSGKIVLSPLGCLEDATSVTNPLPDIAGLKYVMTKLLALPQNLTTAAQQTQWTRLLGELPDLPTRVTSGKTIFAPWSGATSGGANNNAELYGVFPYQLSGVGKSNLQMGIDTFNNRGNTQDGYSWHGDAVEAAMLGLSSTAQSMVVGRISASWPYPRGLVYGVDANRRFPSYSTIDWAPETSQGKVACTALQRMLVQFDVTSTSDNVLLFPAWPSNWDVEFRQPLPKNRFFFGEYKSAAVKWIDPDCDGVLSQADYRLVMADQGYNNHLGKGDFTSLLLGDVNLDGQVNDADRVALFAAAAELGIDTSGWTVPEPGTAAMIASALGFLLALRKAQRRVQGRPF